MPATKLATQLRSMSLPGTPAHEAAALLDEAERVLARAESHFRYLPAEMDLQGSVMHDMTTVLAKLRGVA